MKYRIIILLAAGLITLCSCAGKASVKAMVDTNKAAESSVPDASIQQGINAGVIKTSGYFEEFYSVDNRYMITDEKELEIFSGYMQDEGMAERLSNRLGSGFLDNNALFIVPIQSGSGGYRYNITKAAVEGDTLSLLWHCEGDEVMTCDMAMYYPYALVPKELLKGKSCSGWIVPSSHKITVYRSYTVSATFEPDRVSLQTLRSTAEKYNAAQGTISLYAVGEKREITCSFEILDSGKADALTKEMNSLGAEKASFSERTIQPGEYEKYISHSGSLSISNATADVLAEITDTKDYDAAVKYFRNTLKGEITDENIHEDDYDSFYSLSVSMDKTDDTDILQLFESLETVPYNTDELKIHLYYSMN